MSKTCTPCLNQLLASLPATEFARLMPHLEPVSMHRQQVLCESGMHLRHVYFPTTAIASLLYVTEDGESSEIAMVGNEGIVGVSLFTGGETTLSRIVVRSAGEAYRLKGKFLSDEFYRGGPMQSLLLLYIQALLTQMAQTLLCNRHHSLDQQFCRWLLQLFDRLPTSKLAITQELIASTLGVRRGGISEVAGNMQKAGLIKYHRGCITLLDRTGLEARACECYAVVKREFDRLLHAADSSLKCNGVMTHV